MRSLFFPVLLAALLSLTGSLAVAQTDDGLTPAEENVCEPLQADGTTPGLYGLCVAYCEAEARSESVLESYNRRRTEADPAMPCLAVNPGNECPCWDRPIVNLDSSAFLFCTETSATFAVFGGSFELFEVESGACSYLYDDGAGSLIMISSPLTGDVEADLCLQSIADVCGN